MSEYIGRGFGIQSPKGNWPDAPSTPMSQYKEDVCEDEFVHGTSGDSEHFSP